MLLFITCAVFVFLLHVVSALSSFQCRLSRQLIVVVEFWEFIVGRNLCCVCVSRLKIVVSLCVLFRVIRRLIFRVCVFARNTPALSSFACCCFCLVFLSHREMSVTRFWSVGFFCNCCADLVLLLFPR